MIKIIEAQELEKKEKSPKCTMWAYYLKIKLYICTLNLYYFFKNMPLGMHFSQKTYRNALDDFDQHVALIWQNHVQKLSTDEDDNCNDHQNSWNTEGKWKTIIHSEARNVFAENRGDGGGNQGTSVDGKVEKREEDGELFCLLWHLELFATKSSDTRLDTTRTQRNQRQAENRESSRGQVPGFDSADSNDHASNYVHNREPQNCPEFSPPTVGDDGSEDAEEIDENIEGVIENSCRIIIVHQFSRQIKHENGFHAVEVETFTELIADDERNGTGVFQLFFALFRVLFSHLA